MSDWLGGSYNFIRLLRNRSGHIGPGARFHGAFRLTGVERLALRAAAFFQLKAFCGIFVGIILEAALAAITREGLKTGKARAEAGKKVCQAGEDGVK